jgi:hypothetical protein
LRPYKRQAANYRADRRADFASPWQRSEQYFTSSQVFAHFLRQTIGLPHCAQDLTGSSDFFICYFHIGNAGVLLGILLPAIYQSNKGSPIRLG